MARHVVVDLAFILGAPPKQAKYDRLPPEQLSKLIERLDSWGLFLNGSGDADERLSKWRREYEPYLAGLAHHLMLTVPPVWREKEELDSWQTSAWDDDAHF